jgi:photosystem II stability/assembly factor-like uncharacterized protein
VSEASLTIDPTNPEQLAAVNTRTSKQDCEQSNCIVQLLLFTSQDGGETWETLTQGLPAEHAYMICGIQVSPRDPNHVFAAYTDGRVYHSTDGGETWSDSVSPPLSGCILWAYGETLPMAMDPTDPNTLYLGGEFDGDYGLLKTTDGGANWINPGWGCCSGRALAIDPTNPTTLYGGARSGVLKSANGAATWSNTGLRAGVNALALDPIDPSILYASTHGANANSFEGLLKSRDSGVSWSPINDGLAILIDTRSPVTALVVDPANAQVLYAGTSGYGVFRSIDGGASWSQFIDGLMNLDIRLLALTPGKAATLYAGTGNGVFAISLAPETIR